jgi:hypothetical protein
LPQVCPVDVPGAIAGGLSVDEIAVSDDQEFTRSYGH